MTVAVVMMSLIPVRSATGVGADLMKPIAAPIAGGMVTSTIHVLILVPVFFAMIREEPSGGIATSATDTAAMRGCGSTTNGCAPPVNPARSR